MMIRSAYLLLFVFIFFSQNSFSAQDPAPEIKLPGVDGVVHLEDLKDKVVYLDFWASCACPVENHFPGCTI